MTPETIHDGILQSLAAVAPEADLSTLAPDADLRETLDIDSMDFLSFVTELHKTLGVDVPEADYAKIGTLAGCEQYLSAKT